MNGTEKNESTDLESTLRLNEGDDSDSPNFVLIRSVALSGIFIILLIAALDAASEILIPFVIAYALSLLLSPVIGKMTRYRIPAPLSAALVMVAFIGLTFTALYHLYGPAEKWIERSPKIVSQLQAKINPILGTLTGAQQAASTVDDLMAGRTTDQSIKVEPVKVVVEGSDGQVQKLVDNISSTLGSIGIVVVLLYFLLAAGDKFLSKLVAAIPKFEDKKQAVSIIRDIQRDTSRYLIMRTLINIGLGCAVAFALYLLGMPNPLLWGAMAALLNFAPYVGPAISLGIISIAAVISMDSIAEALMVPAVVLIINIIEGEFISHHVIGKRLSLSPIVVFISIVFWGWLWGVPGALMAIPIIAAINVVFQHIDALRPFSNFISEANNTEANAK